MLLFGLDERQFTDKDAVGWSAYHREASPSWSVVVVCCGNYVWGTKKEANYFGGATVGTRWANVEKIPTQEKRTSTLPPTAVQSDQ